MTTESQAATCPSCQTSIPANIRFCPNCGASLAIAAGPVITSSREKSSEFTSVSMAGESAPLDGVVAYMLGAGWTAEEHRGNSASFISTRSGRRVSLHVESDGRIIQDDGPVLDLEGMTAQLSATTQGGSASGAQNNTQNGSNSSTSEIAARPAAPDEQVSSGLDIGTPTRELSTSLVSATERKATLDAALQQYTRQGWGVLARSGTNAQVGKGNQYRTLSVGLGGQFSDELAARPQPQTQIRVHRSALGHLVPLHRPQSLNRQLPHNLPSRQRLPNRSSITHFGRRAPPSRRIWHSIRHSRPSTSALKAAVPSSLSSWTAKAAPWNCWLIRSVSTTALQLYLRQHAGRMLFQQKLRDPGQLKLYSPTLMTSTGRRPRADQAIPLFISFLQKA